jgi:hypothetical protein
MEWTTKESGNEIGQRAGGISWAYSNVISSNSMDEHERRWHELD